MRTADARRAAEPAIRSSNRPPTTLDGAAGDRGATHYRSTSAEFPALTLIPAGPAVRMWEDGGDSGRRYRCDQRPSNGSRRNGCA